MDPKETFDLLYTKALKFLSHRPRSEKEVRDRLLRKIRRGELSDRDIVEGIITLLKKQKFLDDSEFAVWWVRQRTEFKPRSISLIKRELIQKGISKDIIDETLEGTQEKDFYIDEVEMAKKLVAKRIGKFNDIDRNVIYTKLGQYLSRRGFSWEIIKRAIDDHLK